MASKSLRVIARLKARSDRVNELQALLVGLLKPTREESGCISYQLLQAREDATEFTFVEEWTDEAAFEAHFDTTHIRSAVEHFPDLLAEALEIRRYNVVG